MPRIANHFAKKEEEHIKRTMLKTINYVYFCAFPLAFGLIATAPNFVPVYLGDGYEKSRILIQIFAPIILIIGLNNIIGNQYLLPTQQQNIYTKAVIIGTITNFTLNLILINLIGSYGAAIATIISEIIVLTIELYHVRKQFNILEWIKKSRNYLIASIIMFLVCYTFINVTQNLIVNCIVQVTVGVLIYLIILVVLKDEFLNDIIKKCIKIIKGVN